jgi:hypothetical protein
MRPGKGVGRPCCCTPGPCLDRLLEPRPSPRLQEEQSGSAAGAASEAEASEEPESEEPEEEEEEEEESEEEDAPKKKKARRASGAGKAAGKGAAAKKEAPASAKKAAGGKKAAAKGEEGPGEEEGAGEGENKMPADSAIEAAVRELMSKVGPGGGARALPGFISSPWPAALTLPSMNRPCWNIPAGGPQRYQCQGHPCGPEGALWGEPARRPAGRAVPLWALPGGRRVLFPGPSRPRPSPYGSGSGLGWGRGSGPPRLGRPPPARPPLARPRPAPRPPPPPQVDMAAKKPLVKQVAQDYIQRHAAEVEGGLAPQVGRGTRPGGRQAGASLVCPPGVSLARARPRRALRALALAVRSLPST